MDEAGDILYSPSPSSTTLLWVCHRLKESGERGKYRHVEHLGCVQALYISPKLELAMCKSPRIWRVCLIDKPFPAKF